MAKRLNKLDPGNCQVIKRRICDQGHGQCNCPGNASVHRSVHEEILATVSKIQMIPRVILFETRSSLYLFVSYVAGFPLPDWELQ